MMPIYVIYEADCHRSYDSMIIKHMTTLKREAKDFFDTYKKNYHLTKTDYNLYLAVYENNAIDMSDESNILRELEELESTENEE